jgi:hypothetical protein
MHVDGAPEGWTLYEVGPAGSPILLFDVFEDSSKVLHLAIAVKNTDGTHHLEYATLPVPALTYNKGTNMVEGFDPKSTKTTPPISLRR